MRASMGVRARQWLLLCGLALAVLGMHHVALTPHETPHDPPLKAVSGGTHTAVAMPMAVGAPAEQLPEARSSNGSGTGMVHDLMHLCLAVLCATGGLLLVWFLIAVSGGFHARSTGLRPPVWQAWRLPSAAGRSLLASVCVLRI